MRVSGIREGTDIDCQETAIDQTGMILRTGPEGHGIGHEIRYGVFPIYQNTSWPAVTRGQGSILGFVAIGGPDFTDLGGYPGSEVLKELGALCGSDRDRLPDSHSVGACSDIGEHIVIGRCIFGTVQTISIVEIGSVGS